MANCFVLNCCNFCTKYLFDSNLSKWPQVVIMCSISFRVLPTWKYKCDKSLIRLPLKIPRVTPFKELFSCVYLFQTNKKWINYSFFYLCSTQNPESNHPDYCLTYLLLWLRFIFKVKDNELFFPHISQSNHNFDFNSAKMLINIHPSLIKRPTFGYIYQLKVRNISYRAN